MPARRAGQGEDDHARAARARAADEKRASTAAAKEYLESQKGAKGGDAELTALKRSLAEMERKIKSLSQLKDLDSAGTRATRLST